MILLLEAKELAVMKALLLLVLLIEWNELWNIIAHLQGNILINSAWVMCPPLNQSLFPGEKMLNDWPTLDYVTETRIMWQGREKEWGEQELWLASLFELHKWEKGEYQKGHTPSIWYAKKYWSVYVWFFLLLSIVNFASFFVEVNLVTLISDLKNTYFKR